MYQGEDWSQQLSYFEDVAQTTPLVLSLPVMDLRKNHARLATFDTTGASEGLITISSPGVLELTMAWPQTAIIPAGLYPLDIFAEVNGQRVAITKIGELQLEVSARSTEDANP